MKLSYNVTGAERKALVVAISQMLNAQTKYLGAPTFAYEVGAYHIDKSGTLTGPDNSDLEDLLRKGGFIAVGPDYYVPEPDDDIGLTIEMPRSTFTDGTLKNLRRLMESKAALIKKALGADSLEIELTDEMIRFPWFESIPEPEVISATTCLIEKMLDTAKNQQRVTAKEKETDNEKYAFRCFLLRLGFIGDEYKEMRRTLLRNLTGSAAFRTEAAKNLPSRKETASDEISE